MWEYTLICTTDVPAPDLYAVLADLPGWSAWNDAVRLTNRGEVLGQVPGIGAAVPLCLDAFAPPRTVTVVARLPFARLLARYDVEAAPEGSLLVVSLRLEGVLAAWWRKPVAGAASRGLAAHFHRLLDRARFLAGQPLLPAMALPAPAA